MDEQERSEKPCAITTTEKEERQMKRHPGQESREQDTMKRMPSRKRRSAKTIYRQTHATNNKQTTSINHTPKHLEKVCGESAEGHSSRRDKSHENCLQDRCLCLLYTQFLKIDEAKDFQPHLYVSLPIRAAATKRMKIVVLSSVHFVSQDPLQEPCLHQYQSSTRSTSSGSCLSIFVSQAPLQDPCLWIHGSPSICISGSSARSMSPDPYLSIHMYLRILCKLQDPCLRFLSQHLISQGPLRHPCLRIHVSASICISGSSARSMSPDPCLRFMSQHPLIIRIRRVHDPCISIHVSASLCVDPLQDPYLSIHTRGSCTKSTRRCSKSDSTRTNPAEGCMDVIKIGTALQRERFDTHELHRGLHEH